ncbi:MULTISPECIES: hypothetical protein [unclassified Treponema]|uniref:hypothetical protein n=1 Tax=unclassified Treponema TaxID=2638727 RepID=UPI0020A35956|nr:MULTISPECIES: hypothetical protein [unclassified Treponema]UTC68138.1 hypothetical protein E4O06_05755 [Treponema sp. OMZ 789]UTC70860.1 hypothetical protein E4O01_05900 [Treponema sp. OMZ 790]UTC73600.1 hypothetical protein E4O02_06095 [Treponema sp. OMZ 791]
MSTNSKKIKFLLFLFLIKTSVIFAQSFSIPHFENTNLLYGINKAPYVTGSSALLFKLRFAPHHTVYFDMDIDANIEKLPEFFYSPQDPQFDGKFRFWGASINFPKIKNKPVAIGIFTGKYDTLGSDSVLQELLKTKIPEPEFRRHHPGSAFRPRNFVQGTGLGIYGAFTSRLYMGTYVTWNEKINDDLQIKSDFRLGGAFDFFAFDFFAGASFPKNLKKTKLRAGVAVLFKTDDDYDFFSEAGLAEIKIENMSVKDFTSNFYASFEARIKKNFMQSAVACFVSPVFLLPQSIKDPSLKDSFFMGLSADISFGNSDTHGGIHLMGTVNPLKPTVITPFSFLVSPFYTLKFESIEFDFRLPVNPLLYNDISKMITAQISIKAVY